MGAVRRGVVLQPAAGETVCGDAYCVVKAEGVIVAGVADGLGHGVRAAEASSRAIATIEADPLLPPEELLARCHAALRSTRGAVVAVARIEPAAGRLLYAALGNIEARLVGVEQVLRPVAANGIIGYGRAKLRAQELPYAPGDLLLMYSDGISDRFEVSPASRGQEPQEVAERIAFGYGRHHDDQLILALAERP